MATDLQSAPFGHLGTCPNLRRNTADRKVVLVSHQYNDGKEEQAGPRTAPPVLEIKEEVMSSGYSLVQETADSIGEVTLSQVPTGQKEF